ncbi:MAG: ABC transporter substrate-binding protein [Armatimonadota bacterium]
MSIVQSKLSLSRFLNTISQRLRTSLTLAALLVAMLVACSAFARSDDKALQRVTLQLKWTHAFQFAGYYAAAEKGYYRQAGLDVKILEATPGTDPLQNVLSGKAQYGVGTSSLILARQAGKPVVALAVIFQHSPYVLIARQESATQGLHAIVGKRVMLEPQSDELIAYLKAEGIPVDRIHRVEHSYDPKDLIDGNVFAIAGYVTNQPYYLNRAHLPYQIYTPRSAGIDFYGDNLFTTETELKNHPARVKAFRAAGLRGWHYAMDHQEEIADLILAKYSRKHSRDYYLFEAKQMEPLLVPNLIELGYMYEGRWRHIADTYAEIGMMKRGVSLDGFLYNPNPLPPDLRWLYLTLLIILSLMTIISSVAIYISRTNTRLRQEARVRFKAQQALLQEQSYITAILNSIPGIFYLYSFPDLKMVMWNTQHEILFGYGHDEMLGRSVFDWHAPEMHDKLLQTITQFEPVGHAVFESLLVTKDGSYIPYLLSGAEFIREGQRYLIGVGTDISDRIKTERALRESEQILSQAQEVARLGYFVTDIKTGVWRSSSVLDQIFGIDDEFVRDIEHWAMLLVPEYRQNTLDYYYETINNKSRFDMDYKIIRPSDGQVRWVWSVGEVDCDDEGNPVRQVGTIQDITERKLAEEALAHSRAEIKAIYDSAPVMICVLDSDSCIQYANAEFLTFVNITEQQLIGGRACGVFGCVNANDDPRGCGYGPSCAICALRKAIDDTLTTGSRHRNVEYRATLRQGNEDRDVVMLAATTLIQSGIQLRLLLCLLDITELTRAEEEKDRLKEQLQQALKLESVGRLAGGVAHDFNNMLSVIIGHAQIALAQLDSEHPLYDDINEISAAAERSADLTRQLLAFARKQTVVAKVISLNDSVKNLMKMLGRLIGENTTLYWQPQPDIWLVKADSSHVDQIIINLCINARDAIDETGHITIKTRNAVIDDAYCVNQPDLRPGEYVSLTISDDGRGMDKSTQALMFEPFFTTKGVGEGTGLGLATVYGSVKQNHGCVEVNSEPGRGTSISFYLPRYLGETPAGSPAPDAISIPAGQETILLVEDETSILKMTKSLLERMGYTVITSNRPQEAIRLAKQHEGDIQLLISDVVMPEMNGWQMAGHLKLLYPELKLLFMSGYPADVMAHNGMDMDQVHFLSKPFMANDLALKVREVLEAPV